jgi:hypothetical protein
MHPIARQRAVTLFVATDKTWVIPFSIRGCPTRAGWVYEMSVAGEAGMRGVAAVEGDAFPIDKAAGRRCSDAHRIVVIDHPRAAFADAAGAVIETNGDTFLSDVTGGDLIRPKQRRAKVHALIRGWSGQEHGVDNSQNGREKTLHELAAKNAKPRKKSNLFMRKNQDGRDEWRMKESPPFAV